MRTCALSGRRRPMQDHKAVVPAATGAFTLAVYLHTVPV